MRYAIWNNKGGVGKTFLAFVIACEYADQHPDRKVIMLDLCPQANLSEIVLGGNGSGADKLSDLIS
jgi:cellulose biosynthesis protein BcsQ